MRQNKVTDNFQKLTLLGTLGSEVPKYCNSHGKIMSRIIHTVSSEKCHIDLQFRQILQEFTEHGMVPLETRYLDVWAKFQYKFIFSNLHANYVCPHLQIHKI